MKWLDKVKIITSKDEYEKIGVFKNMEGSIVMPELRNNYFLLEMHNIAKGFDVLASIHIEDLELVEDAGLTDEDILKNLPKNDPNWWCKVEDGYILNLKGEKKNKVAYDYNS